MYQFYVIVNDNAPTFTSLPTNMTTMLGVPITQQISCSDSDGHAVSAIINLSPLLPAPSFLTISGTFSPFIITLSPT